MKWIIKSSLLFLLLIGNTSNAQTDQFFNPDLMGQWEGKGHLFGTEANFSMQWEQVLDQKFTKLTFRNQFTDKSGVVRVMEATGFYDVKNKNGHWFDSRGVMLPLALEISDNILTVFWGDDSSAEKGKTVYTLQNKDKISVEDFFFGAGSYTSFGSAEYYKIKKN